MDSNSIHHDTAAAMPGGSHPLQDVELSLATNIPETSTKTVKKNWVKFDDEGNDVDSGNVANNNSNNSRGNDDSDVGAPRSAAAAPDTEHNKLSSLPPPPATRQAPTTTATPNTNTNSLAPMEKTMNKHSATVAPVQRSTVSSSTVETEVAPAVLTTESTHVNLNASGKTQQQEKHQRRQQHQQYPQQQQQQQQKPKTSNVLSGGSSIHASTTTTAAATTTTAISPLHGQHHHNNNGASNKTQSVAIPVESTAPMRTIELSTGRIREGFANGDVIVTLLPANTKWPWITPAIFRPELVPEELMAQGLTLTVEEYVNAMETLVNDYRFTVYNICYKRILVCWILFAFAVLLALLFSGLQGVALFSLGVGWLFLNAAAIFLCMWVKLRLARGLEKCLARVNKQLMRHKILLILDDRGRISCHKVNLCFLYFDATQCVNFLNEFLEQTEQNGGDAIKAGWEAKLDLDLNDIVIQGNNPVRLSRKQERGMQLFLRYGSRWGMEALRGLVDVTPLEPGRHCGQFQCPCQYIKQHLQCKPRANLKNVGDVIWTRFTKFGN